MNPSPVVSIAVLAYNLEKFVGQCIKSLVEQEFDQSFEIVIGEDYSTDDTREVCLQWKKKYPELIKLILRSENVGMSANFKDVVDNCSGKYIAFCEGDDYWIDKYKLQSQFDFLEKNLSFGLVHTRFNLVNESGNEIFSLRRETPTGHVLKELIQYSFIGTLTVMIRTFLIKQTLNDNYALIIGNGKAVDYPLWLCCAAVTKIGYINRITATYRIMVESASHSKDITKLIAYSKNNKEIAISFKKKYFPNDRNMVRSINNTYYYGIMKESVRARNVAYLWRYYFKLINNHYKNLFEPKVYYFLLKGMFKKNNI